MKTKFFPSFRRRMFFVTCVGGLLAFTTACDYLPDFTDDDDTPEELSLEKYFEKIQSITYADTTQQTYATAKEYITASAKAYAEQFAQASKLKPPQQVKEAHEAFIKALADQAASNQAAAGHTPADLPATNEYINGYAHYWPEVGYARNDQAAAGCELEAIAKSNNIDFDGLGECSVYTPEIPDGKSIGTAENPVNEVYILHKAITLEGTEMPIPNVFGFEYDSITARANEPLTITFDNRNPAPFVFNIAIYDGNDERVTAQQYVAGTLAYAGEKVHVLAVTLKPGIYTYVDNVHPVAVRGCLTVVP